MSKSAFSYSSIAKKIVMSLAGLFLTSFLVVHLIINLLILFDDSRELFNQAAHFMATNALIQVFQYVLFFGFILHIILGLILQIQNWVARPIRYEKKGFSELSYFSKFMIHTGAIIFIFLIIHFVNFFIKAKFGHIEPITYASGTYEDLGLLIVKLFEDGGYVIFYVISILLLGFHLDHGFQSAFQSLGLNHSRYTPFIKAFGTIFSIALTLGFIAIPLVIYFS
ncbi:MAG: succinate dehydrogenase cytochrome b subunit [Bacteroidetes bacterium]|jgi:succinate dehydrogenase / fumarate reductase cytochrome b subunit|nr:succinate dehydrogenase cytochrome b subunit [Bacteroidota bacterium]